MKQVPKSSIFKYIATMCLVAMMGIAVAQPSETDRLANAVEELYELKQMDKSTMTKAEKKAWKARKRALRRIIDIEQDRLDAEHFAVNPWRYNRRFGNPYFGPYGYPGYFPRRRVVVVNPQSCEVPAQTQYRRTQRTQRVARPQPRTPSSVRRR